MAIHAKLGNTVLMITHDVDEAVLLSDRIVMMTNGPAARIGEILDVPLPRPRKRLALAGDADVPEVPPARARIPLRAPPLRRSGMKPDVRRLFTRAEALPRRLHVGPADRARRARARRRQARGRGADRPRRRAHRGAGPHRRGRRQAQRPGEVQARASIRSTPTPAQGAGREQRAAEARRQFPLALLRPVLRRAGAELLHVPAADAERHPQALADVRPRRPRRALRRRLLARHHARQFADPRDRAEERGRAARGDPGPRPLLARLRRRQHPQRHRHADRRHRSAGTDRHAALRARMALPHPQRARALRPAAQVQRRVRRRRHRSRCWRTPTTSASRRSR